MIDHDWNKCNSENDGCLPFLRLVLRGMRDSPVSPPSSVLPATAAEVFFFCKVNAIRQLSAKIHVYPFHPHSHKAARQPQLPNIYRCCALEAGISPYLPLPFVVSYALMTRV